MKKFKLFLAVLMTALVGVVGVLIPIQMKAQTFKYDLWELKSDGYYYIKQSAINDLDFDNPRIMIPDGFEYWNGSKWVHEYSYIGYGVEYMAEYATVGSVANIIIYKKAEIEVGGEYDYKYTIVFQIDKSSFKVRTERIMAKAAITGEFTQTYDIDKGPITESDILAKLHIKAENGQTLDHLLKIENFSIYKNEIGEYKLNVSAKVDDDVHKQIVTVIVADLTAPTINGPEEIPIVNKIAQNELIEQNYTANDNVDGVVNVVVYQSNYLHATTPGIYTITLRATDKAGNIAERVVKINWKDTKPPIINGPSKIIVGTSTYFDLKKLANLCTVTDDGDGVIPSSEIFTLKDEFSGNGNKVGKYNVELAVKDSSGNSSVKVVEIVVSKNLKNVMLVDEVIMVSNNHKLDYQGFIEVLYELNPGLKKMPGLQVIANIDDYTNKDLNNWQKIGYKLDVTVSYKTTNATNIADDHVRLEVIGHELFAVSNEQINNSKKGGSVIGAVIGIGIFTVALFGITAIIKKRKGRY